MRAPILLVGMMGAGKSTVGGRLADRLGWTYVDNDLALHAATRRTAAELLDLEGPQRLHEAELDALRWALGRPEPAVIGVAGSVPLHAEAPDLLGAGTVVWLRASETTLAARVRADSGVRPWLGRDPATTLAELAAARTPAYGRVADVVIDVDALAPDEIVERILASLPG